MNTSTVSRSHDLHSRVSHVTPKAAPKTSTPEVAKKVHDDHARLSQEAEGLVKKTDTHKEVGKTTETSKPETSKLAEAGKPVEAKNEAGEATKPEDGKGQDESSIDERIAALEKELEALKKEYLDYKGDEKKADAPAGGSKGGGAASDKGPTVMNPDAPAGFLWKPESDSDGKLAILLPPSMSGKVSRVEVLSPDGQVLASGRGAGIGNGDREHFRFSQPGGAFPPNSKVKITMKDGSQQEITIPQTSVRNEGGGKK